MRILKGIFKFFSWFCHYSGLKFIWRKFVPEKGSKPLPTGPIWLLGIYLALFGIASQRYENRIDIIENRANAIFTQLATPVFKKSLSRVARVQNMLCPKNPIITKPTTVFRSLFGKDTSYNEMVELLKEIIENFKGSLNNVSLMSANLEGANLRRANLRRANLRRANLEGARNLTVDQLSKVKNLYEAKLDSELMEKMKKDYPQLLEEPKFNE